MDLQPLYQLGEKVGMSVMAADMIDPWYADMKTKFPQEAHHRWDNRPLPKINMEYAAIDAFVAFELYRLMLERIHAGLPVRVQRPRLPVRVQLQDHSDESGTDVPEDSSDEEEAEKETRGVSWCRMLPRA